MKKLFYFILCSPSFSNSQSVEQLYGDRIELLGIPFKDPLVLCQIFIALFLVIVFLQSSMDKIFDRGNNLAFFESHFSKSFLKYFIPYLLTIITVLNWVEQQHLFLVYIMLLQLKQLYGYFMVL